MKILILTQPLRNNYGGILQAYALQTVLKKMGHEAVTDSKPYGSTIIRRIVGTVKRTVFRYILRKEINTHSVFYPLLLSAGVMSTISRHTVRFAKENMTTVDFFKGRSKPNRAEAEIYDAIITGSDQVWRKRYSNVPVYLLDFTKGMNIKRIAYAASFGTDDLSEYTPRLIKHTAELAQQFDAISVREDTGVFLCKKHWGVEAVHLLDPTLLPAKDDYIRLVRQDSKNITPSRGNLFVYILDSSAEKQRITDKVSTALHLSAFEILPEDIHTLRNRKGLEKYTFPPVTQWLQSFMDAEFVITDSFHGTVFSIIFNKPFITTGNQSRGMARISSLLKMFNLEDRLISASDGITDEILFNKTDWQNINSIISDKRKESVRFLSDSLNG
ncbi:MAG: polysaccharide pyruvyl transferase family protein [Proteiniphilum sp.]|nr:polysaccharide pyruvyl transferase family protein [Proteiniphilum sp.]